MECLTTKMSQVKLAGPRPILQYARHRFPTDLPIHAQSTISDSDTDQDQTVT